MRTTRVMGLVCGLLLAGGFSASGQNDVAFEALTVADSSIGITSTVRSPSGRPPNTACTARLETAQIRYRFDGTAPTSTVGTLVEIGDIVTIHGAAHMAAFRAIRTGGTSGILAVHCYVDNR